MSLIQVERIKLLSTRSPWWCMIVSAVLAIGLASLATGLTPDKATVTPAMSQFGVGLAQMVMMVMAALVGEIAAFGSWGVGALFAGTDQMAIDTGAEWRLIAGQGLVYAISAVIAVAVGILLRQSAAAIAILILWPVLVENLVQLIPKIGDDLQKWAPFVNSNQFLNGGQDMGAAGADSAGPLTSLSPWMALLYFAGWGVGLLVIALFVTSKRDA